MRLCTALLAMLVAAPAYAEPVDVLEAEGEQLAKTGEYTKAIDAFKQADHLEVRARHACMIGLAYLRRELWPQAELYFDLCKQRSSVEDPLPDWFQGALDQLAQKLAGTSVSQVTITVSPAAANAQIHVSSFAPDEGFAPRKIHLAPGTHTITVTAPGFMDQRRDFVVAESTPLTVDVVLERPGAHRHTVAPRSKVPWIVVGVGAALAVGGGIVHLAVTNPAHDDVDAAAIGPRDVYDAKAATFRRDRAITIGLYAGGAVAIVTGLVLRSTVFAPKQIEVTAQLGDGGAMLGVGWHH